MSSNYSLYCIINMRRRNVVLKIPTKAPILSSFITSSFPPLTGAQSLGWKGHSYGGKEKKVLGVLFFLPLFHHLNHLKHRYNSEHLLRCIYFLIFLFLFSFSQFTNEDDESQKFLTNGFLGKKKLADYDDEHVSESLLSGNKHDLRVSDLPRSLWENNVTEIFQALISTFSVYSGPYWNKGLFFLFAIWLHKSFMKFICFFGEIILTQMQSAIIHVFPSL